MRLWQEMALRHLSVGLVNRAESVGSSCSRSVNDTINFTESRQNLIHRVQHLGLISYVRNQDQDLGAQFLNALNAANLSAHRIVFITCQKPFGPFLFGRKTRASYQGQPGPHRFGQFLCEFKTDISETSSNEIDSALA